MMTSLITGLNKDSLKPFCYAKLLYNLCPFNTRLCLLAVKRCRRQVKHRTAVLSTVVGSMLRHMHVPRHYRESIPYQPALAHHKFLCLVLVMAGCGMALSQQSLNVNATVIILKTLKAFQAKWPHLVLYFFFYFCWQSEETSTALQGTQVLMSSTLVLGNRKAAFLLLFPEWQSNSIQMSASSQRSVTGAQLNSLFLLTTCSSPFPFCRK